MGVFEMYRTALAATAAFLISTSASAAELIVNGGFENPTITDPCCSTVPPEALPGWTIDAGNVNVVNGTFGSSAGNLAKEGKQYLDLVGQGGIGSLSQSFATVAGQIYTLNFSFSHNLFGGNTPSASAAFLVGGFGGTVSHSTGSTSNLDWQSFAGNFTATGPTSTLKFTNLTGGSNEGIFLDAVSVQSAVPEPATWAMMLMGFAGIGFGMRRRRAVRGILQIA